MIIFIVVFFTPVFGQEVVEAAASVSKNKAKLGEAVRYTITVKIQGQGGVVRQPELVPPSFDGFRLSGTYSQSGINMINNRVETTVTRHFDLIPVKTGENTIEPATVRFADGETGAIKEIQTKPVAINVESGRRLLPASPTPTEAPAPQVHSDIREIRLSLEFRLRDILPYILLGIFFIIAAGAAYYFIFGRKKEEFVPDAVVDFRREAEKMAVKAATEIKKGNVKKGYTLLYEAVRYFFSARTGVSIYELTTPEILSALKKAGFGDKKLDIAGEFLKECDIVKFADYVPGDKENEAVLQKGLEIIAKF